MNYGSKAIHNTVNEIPQKKTDLELQKSQKSFSLTFWRLIKWLLQQSKENDKVKIPQWDQQYSIYSFAATKDSILNILSSNQSFKNYIRFFNQNMAKSTSRNCEEDDYKILKGQFWVLRKTC